MSLGKEVSLGPGHIVLDGVRWDPAPTAALPRFRPMPIVAKLSPISATAELLLNMVAVRQHGFVVRVFGLSLEHLVVFIVLQNLVGIDVAFSIV